MQMTPFLLQFVEFLSGILSISCVVLLGFADDVIDLKWRHKFLLPAVAAAPMLTVRFDSLRFLDELHLQVYWANNGGTTVMLPAIISHYVGATAINIGECLDRVCLMNELQFAGILYYVYMTLLAIFCTHAINILAGINGLEAGQSLVIAVSVAIFNVVQLYSELTGSFSLPSSRFRRIGYARMVPLSVIVLSNAVYWSHCGVVAIQLVGFEEFLSSNESNFLQVPGECVRW